jgi:hypothetical protein
MATERVVSRFTPTRRLPDTLAGTPSPLFAADLLCPCRGRQRPGNNPTGTSRCQEMARGAGRASSIDKEAI